MEPGGDAICQKHGEPLVRMAVGRVWANWADTVPSVALADRLSDSTTSPVPRSTRTIEAVIVFFFRSESAPCTDRVELEDTSSLVLTLCVAEALSCSRRLRSWRL